MGRSEVNKGFTLIELMIVVAVVAIIVAIALPVMFPDKYKKTQQESVHSLCIEGYKFVQSRYDRAQFAQVLDSDGNGIRCNSDYNYTTVE